MALIRLDWAIFEKKKIENFLESQEERRQQRAKYKQMAADRESRWP